MLFLLLEMANSPEDKRKIELLYEKYNRLVFSNAYSVVENHHDAEDIAFLSCEKVIINIEKFKDISSNETKKLLMVITERTALDFCKRKKTIMDAEQYVEQSTLDTYMVSKDMGIENVELCESLNKIPKKYRDVLILYYVNGLSTKDIGDVLGISEGTAAKRLYRGRERLKEMRFDEFFGR